MDTIHYADAIQQTKQRDETGRPVPFSIRFVTFDKKRKQGGEIIELDNAVRTGLQANTVEHQLIGVKQLHNSHHPYSVHTRLITMLNDKKVYY